MGSIDACGNTPWSASSVHRKPLPWDALDGSDLVFQEAYPPPYTRAHTPLCVEHPPCTHLHVSDDHSTTPCRATPLREGNLIPGYMPLCLPSTPTHPVWTPWNSPPPVYELGQPHGGGVIRPRAMMRHTTQQTDTCAEAGLEAAKTPLTFVAPTTVESSALSSLLRTDVENGMLECMRSERPF